MLGLSKSTGYAVAALRCLSDPACAAQPIEHISKCSVVPRHYLAKIVGSLVRAGLVKTKRGIHGGISLARDPQDITLLDIVLAVEGDEWISGCLLGLDECTDLTTCPTHDFWQRIGREITAELKQTTLQAVIAFMDPKQGKSKQAGACCNP